MKKNRITCVVGAGAALGFQLPPNVIPPSTGNITDEVRKPWCQQVLRIHFVIKNRTIPYDDVRRKLGCKLTQTSIV